MRGLIRSQFYSLFAEKKLILTVFVIITLVCGISAMVYAGDLLFTDVMYYNMKPNASMLFGRCASDFALYGLIFTALIAGQFAVRDFSDKTINYEIMAGHGRREIFFSRVIVSMLQGGIGGTLMLFIVPVIYTIRVGWGGSIHLSTAALKVFLVFLLYCRVSAELIFFAVILKQTKFVFAAEALIALIELVLMAEAEGSQYVFALSAIYAIMNFNEFDLSHLDGKWEFFFDSAFEPMTTAAVSLGYIAVSVLFIFCAYKEFERCDLE